MDSATMGENNGEKSDELLDSVTRNAGCTKQIDTVLECLRDERRRHLLYYVARADEEAVSVEEAVEAVRRYQFAGAETTDLPERQSVRTSLVHDHLPRLNSAGVIEYDPRRAIIRYRGDPMLDGELERFHDLEID